MDMDGKHLQEAGGSTGASKARNPESVFIRTTNSESFVFLRKFSGGRTTGRNPVNTKGAKIASIAEACC
jgi:hypothetical protein